MQNVLLIVHLIIAVCLIAAVLLQRSEGGALGIGGGGGGGVSTRPRVTPIAKLTWGLASAFLFTSITLAILAGGEPVGQSVLDEVGGGAGEASDGIVLPDLGDAPGDGMVPPAAEDADTGAAGSGGTGTGGETAPVAPPTAD